MLHPRTIFYFLVPMWIAPVSTRRGQFHRECMYLFEVGYVSMDEECAIMDRRLFDSLTEGATGEVDVLQQLLGIETPALPLDVPEITDIREHVNFQVHTRRTGADGHTLVLDQSALRKSTFKADKPVKIFVHGFLGRLRDGWMTTAKNALLTVEDANVILVGWTNITQILLYPWVVEKSYGVAQYVGQLIDFLVQNGTPLKGIHIVGHSVGAHIAGVASTEAESGVVGRITGLDAAYPLYKGLRELDKLDKSDADFVDCIHTSSGLLGIPEPFCHADFYPNGGTLYQPGCDVLFLAICGHRRSHDYFIESIDPGLKFRAFTCSTTSLLSLLDCADHGAVMGYPCTSEHKGVFYVPTNDHVPYSVVDMEAMNVPAALRVLMSSHRKISSHILNRKLTPLFQ